MQREAIANFDGPFEGSRWMNVNEARDMATSLPATYELAIGTSASKIEAVVYAGATVEEAQRANQYRLGGSHIKKLFEEAKDKGFTVYMRTRKCSTTTEAFVLERQLHRTFDYAWCDRNNGKKRDLDAVLKNTNSKTEKLVVPKLAELSPRERELVEQEALKQLEQQRSRHYETRLKKAEEDPTTLDNIKPRALLFKKGIEYDASKPLREQLDMRNKLNKLYVERMESRNKSLLDEPSMKTDKTKEITEKEILRKDGKPDMRYKENKQKTNGTKIAVSETNDAPLRKDGNPDMRFKSNREKASAVSSPSTPGPLTKSGRPDMRYKANLQRSSVTKSSSSSSYSRSSAASSAAGPLTKSGKPDMRYSANKNAYGGGGRRGKK